jgi:hypothetical protein
MVGSEKLSIGCLDLHGKRQRFGLDAPTSMQTASWFASPINAVPDVIIGACENPDPARVPYRQQPRCGAVDRGLLALLRNRWVQFLIDVAVVDCVSHEGLPTGRSAICFEWRLEQRPIDYDVRVHITLSTTTFRSLPDEEWPVEGPTYS